MRTSLNPLMYKEWTWSRLYEEPGTYEIALTPGVYTVMMRGAGGAGGNNGDGNTGTYGKGGAGGTAELVQETFTLSRAVVATVYVGAGGLTKSNGGNGGDRGEPGWMSTGRYWGGAGGGGGFPTYLKIFTRYILSAGGGGGGGGGGAGERSTSSHNSSAGGGGGGGYYRLERGVVTSVPGKKGATGAPRSGSEYDGANGTAGNTQDFPSLYSGAGGIGHGSISGSKGNGASGGGASGASGGSYTLGSGYTSGTSGAGGGGAGGSTDAGGGTGGPALTGGQSDSRGSNASNPHTTPTLSTNYLGENSNLGRGGNPNENGYGGWLYITLVNTIPAPAIWDLGNINSSVVETTDCGLVTGTTDETLDMGSIE